MSKTIRISSGKRLSKLFLALVLVVAISAGLMVNAFAADATWTAAISQFNLVSSGSDRSVKGGYMRTVQRFLLCYDSHSNDLIANSGGIDGYFGAKTIKAIKYFQEIEHLTADGIVGQNSWIAIARNLDTSFLSNVIEVAGSPYGGNFPWVILSSSNGHFYTYNTNGTSIFNEPIDNWTEHNQT